MQVVQEQSGTIHAPETAQSVDHVDAELRCGMNAEKLNQPISETYNLPASVVGALEKALQAISFMGDTPNNAGAYAAPVVKKQFNAPGMQGQAITEYDPYSLYYGIIISKIVNIIIFRAGS